VETHFGRFGKHYSQRALVRNFLEGQLLGFARQAPFGRHSIRVPVEAMLTSAEALVAPNASSSELVNKYFPESNNLVGERLGAFFRMKWRYPDSWLISNDWLGHALKAAHAEEQAYRYRGVLELQEKERVAAALRSEEIRQKARDEAEQAARKEFERQELRKRILAHIEALLPNGIREARARFELKIDPSVVSLEEFDWIARNFIMFQVDQFLQKDFLNAYSFFKTINEMGLATLADFESRALCFVQEWAQSTLNLKLDDEQAAAVASVNGNVQVVARAGSGKTRVLVTRAMFLHEHCGVLPSEILILAFNKKAVQEIEKRLPKSPQGARPNAMTFHSLAWNLVHPSETMLRDDENSDQMALTKEVHEAINDLQSDHTRENQLKDLMLRFFQTHLEDFVSGYEDLAVAEYRKFRRGLISESLNGTYTKSYGEHLIANILFEHGVKFAYEKAYLWTSGSPQKYRPDFTIYDGSGRKNVAIEYFGMAGDPAYDEQIDRKREYWSRKIRRFEFIECYPNQIDTQEKALAFEEELISKLQGFGFRCERLSEEEIWAQVKTRAFTRFEKSMSSFITRCRGLNLSSFDLDALVEAHRPANSTEAQFLTLATFVYKSYLERLPDGNKEDFSGLMWRAVDEINDGNGIVLRPERDLVDLRKVKYLLVDEFQDFSEMFLGIVQGIRRLAPEATVFGVGDDWQAINGFAGSDLKFFDGFENHFEQAKKITMATNFRSAVGIVEVGNSAMEGKGTPGIANTENQGRIIQVDISLFEPSRKERRKHDSDTVTPAIARLVTDLVERGMEVTILSRTNTVFTGARLDDAQTGFSKEHRFLAGLKRSVSPSIAPKVHLSTAHRYKGQEQDAVIVLDAQIGKYPLIHQTWEFGRIFGDSLDSIEEAERRLLYVALTRAKSELVIVTDYPGPSPFLDKVKALGIVEETGWDHFPASTDGDTDFVEVRLTTSFATKERNTEVLKPLGYRWNGESYYWYQEFSSKSFDLAQIAEAPFMEWVISAEIYDDDDQLLHSLKS